MIVGAVRVSVRRRDVRAGTLLETVRGGRYSPNMCSPTPSSAATGTRLTEED